MSSDSTKGRAGTTPVDTTGRGNFRGPMPGQQPVVRRMPSVVGLDTLTAKRHLAAAELTRYRIVAPGGNLVAVDTVAQQSRRPGDSVAVTDVIFLTLRARPRGQPMTRVPNVVGHRFDSASMTVRQYGLQPVRQVSSETGAPEIVIRQSLPADTLVPPQTALTLWVPSQASLRVDTVPFVVHRTRRIAEALLQRAGLRTPPLVQWEPGDGQPLDTVIAQAPDSGSRVPPNTQVSLTLQRAKPKQMPNLIGFDTGAAKATLSATQLPTPRIDSSSGRGKLLNRIAGQQPPPGAPINANTVILLTLARSQVMLMPRVLGLDTTTADQQMGAVGIIQRRVHLPAADSIAENRIVRQSPTENTVVQRTTIPELWLAGRRVVGPQPGALIVPSVVGLDSAAAIRKLADSGFTSHEMRAPRVGAAMDSVASQSPQPGARAVASVRVVLTLGARVQPGTRIMVPRVIGLRVDTATQVLRAAGLRAGVSGWTPAALHGRETVRSQQPDSGSRVLAGTTVTLVPDERPALIIVIGLFVVGGLAATRVALPPPKITSAIHMQAASVLRPPLDESQVDIALGLRGRLVRLPVQHERTIGSTQS